MIPFDSRMPRVAFFIEPKWAFGSIHYALTKEFFKLGIYADVISWEHNWTDDEKKSLPLVYDYFMSTPYGIGVLHHNYHVPLERCIAVLHSKWDANFFNFDTNKLKSIGSITPQIISLMREKGVTRDINIVRNGIHFDFFYDKPATQLKTLGYAGTFSAGFGEKNWKRSDIALEIQTRTGLRTNFRKSYVNYTFMPAYYSSVDCILVTSTDYEACGLPIMEAAAAGRLPITSNIGIVKDCPGVPFPIMKSDRDKFINDAICFIEGFGSHQKTFHHLCKITQEFAREHYDWSVVIDDWVRLVVP